MTDRFNRVIICGSREYFYRQPMETTIRRLPDYTTIIHGGARGADEMAKWLTKILIKEGRLFTLESHKADWGDDHDPKAGPIRNQLMLDLGADLVLAFRLPGNSPGTDDMSGRAIARGIPTAMWLHHKQEWIRSNFEG